MGRTDRGPRARSWGLLAVGAAGLAVMVACSGGGPGGGGMGGFGGKKDVQPVTVVEVAPVERGAVVDTLVTHAVVESEAQADLYAASAGQVLEVRAEEGDIVHKGDVLAVLDAVALGAGAERANAEVSKLSRELEDLRRLHASGAVSDKELADADYALSAARTSAREASHSYGQTRITAPFDGVVAARDLRVGELASSAQRAFQVVDLDRLRVVAALPERDVARVRVGHRATLVSAYDDDQRGAGHVVRIAPVIDAASGTFRVIVDLDDDARVLRPGQFVSVAIEVDRHADVVVVPREAVVYEEGDPVAYAMVPLEDDEEDGDAEGDAGEDGGIGAQIQAWIASMSGGDKAEGDGDDAVSTDPTHMARRSALTVGLVDDEHAEVIEGVEVGEEVIVVGQSNLRDGAPVRTPEMAAAAAATDEPDAGAESEG